MSEASNTRWLQRFSNFEKAVSQMNKFISKKDLNELEEQGLIQSFEYTHELAWKVIKDFFVYKGNAQSIFGSKDATRQAFQYGLIEHGEVWMQMVTHRNLTSHTYDEKTVVEIVEAIKEKYVKEFNTFLDKMSALKDD